MHAKLRKFFKIIIPTFFACLLPLPAINNVITDIHSEGTSLAVAKATNDLYYATSNSKTANNDQDCNSEDKKYIYDFSQDLIPTPKKLQFTKHDPINPDDPEDLGYYSVMLKPYMEGDVVIPETYNGLPVTQIDKVTSNNFSESLSSNVETIVIPSSITYINKSAFYNSTVKNIVFQGESSPTFDDGAFCSIHHLENIVAPDNYLNNYIEVFSDSRILNCSSLENVNYLPLSALTPLEYLPLVNNEGETKGYSIKLDEEIANEQLNGVVVLPDEYNGLPILKLEDGMFANQWKITSITLPSQLEVIGNQCFYNTNDLNSIIIPSTVKTIGQEVFANSSKYINKDIYFSNEKCILEDINDTSFNGVKNIFIPYSNISIEDTQDTYHSYSNLGKFVEGKVHIQPTLDKYQLKDHHTNINGNYYDTLMVAPKNEYGSNISISGPIIIPSSYSGLAVNIIKENCFVNYGNTPYIYFDDSYDLDHKTSVADERLAIDENAFNNKSIKSVKLPRRNEYLVETKVDGTVGSQDNVFDDNIIAIYVDGKISNNWTYHFDSYNSLMLTFSNYENITMEFEGNHSLDESTLLDFVLRDDGESYAVQLNKHNANASKAKVLEIPSEYNGLPVVEILDYGFTSDGQGLNISSDQINLSTVIIPDSIIKIGSRAFENCKSLQKVEFDQEGSLMVVDDYAFSGCDNIKSLEIPGTITSLSQTSFDNMLSLETITFNGVDDVIWTTKSSSMPQFNGCNNLKNIQVPYINPDKEGNSYKSLFNATNANKLITIPSYEYYNFELVEEEVEDVTIIDNETGEEKPYVDTYYKITPNNILEANRNSIVKLNFPTALDGIPVKKISGDFNNLPNLEKIHIGSNITSLGNEDKNGNSKNFRYCKNLKSIEVDYDNPNFVMMYGASNTTGCLIQGLEVNIDCSNIVTAIGQVDLYGEIYHVGEKSFNGCSAMTEISILTQTYEEKEELGLELNSTMGDLLNKMYSGEELDKLQDEINSSKEFNYTFDELMNYSLLFTVEEEAFHNCDSLTRVNFFSKEIPICNIEGIENVPADELAIKFFDDYMLSIFDKLDIEVNIYCLSKAINPDHVNYYYCWEEMNFSDSGAKGDEWAINETLYRLRDHYEWFVQDIISELKTTDPDAAARLIKIVYIDPEHAADTLNLIFDIANIIVTIISTVFMAFSVCITIESIINKISSKMMFKSLSKINSKIDKALAKNEIQVVEKLCKKKINIGQALCEYEVFFYSKDGQFLRKGIKTIALYKNTFNTFVKPFVTLYGVISVSIIIYDYELKSAFDISKDVVLISLMFYTFFKI